MGWDRNEGMEGQRNVEEAREEEVTGERDGKEKRREYWAPNLCL